MVVAVVEAGVDRGVGFGDGHVGGVPVPELDARGSVGALGTWPLSRGLCGGRTASGVPTGEPGRHPWRMNLAAAVDLDGGRLHAVGQVAEKAAGVEGGGGGVDAREHATGDGADGRTRRVHRNLLGVRPSRLTVM